MKDHSKTESGPQKALPQPTVIWKDNDTDGVTEEELRGMLHNPVYTGLGSFPPLVEKEVWIGAAKQLIEEEGIEQFLVNMLYMLDITMGE